MTLLKRFALALRPASNTVFLGSQRRKQNSYSLMKRLAFLSVLTVAALVCSDSRSCTTFTLQKNGKVVYGRNLDWHADSGLICINARQVAKKSLVLPQKPRPVNPASWISKYGSVTFNSVGREVPTGGMNEAGLVVDVMWLDETRYEKADERPEVNVFQWTQYLLDTCRNVDEVLASFSKVRISEDGFPPQHYLVADRTGKTAVIEFINGKIETRIGGDLPYTCLANNTYTESKTFAGSKLSGEGAKSLPQGEGSLERFTRAAAQVQSFSGNASKLIDYSFDILHSVNAGYELNQHSTVWSIVYDVTGKKIHFRTNGNRERRSIDMAGLDFGNGKPALGWPIVSDAKGDITRQPVPLTDEMNRDTIVRQVTNPGVKAIFGDMSPIIDMVAAYPATCAPAKP